MDYFKNESYKLKILIQSKTPLSNYKGLIINENSFVNTNRDLKKHLAANLETTASEASPYVNQNNLEYEHATKDCTYKNLQNLIKDKDLVAVSNNDHSYFEKK